MKESTAPADRTRLHILLADDDEDDRAFFKSVVDGVPVSVHLSMVQDGEELMTHLTSNADNLPDILFLDLNMPRRNGSECLIEIKQNEKLKHLPVVIYSTASPYSAGDLLYNGGAHYYVRKTDLGATRKILQYVVNQFHENKFVRPAREQFILT